MTVLQTDKIDFISISPEGQCVLTISDHLDWEDETKHLEVLLDKVNAYEGFVTSGQLQSAYANYNGQPVTINIAAQHHVPKRLYEPLRTIFSNQLAELNIGLTWDTLS